MTTPKKFNFTHDIYTADGMTLLHEGLSHLEAAEILDVSDRRFYTAREERLDLTNHRATCRFNLAGYCIRVRPRMVTESGFEAYDEEGNLIHQSGTLGTFAKHFGLTKDLVRDCLKDMRHDADILFQGMFFIQC